MRKFFTIMLSASMLVVSSLPAVSLAALCGDGDLLSNLRASQHAEHQHAMQVANNEHVHHQHANAKPAAELHEGHNHGPVAVRGDMQRERIECGCGCHRNTDGSPLLTTPHLLRSVAMQHGFLVVRTELLPVVSLEALPVSVNLPPPQIFS